jgi:hypothetical protein
LISPDQDKSIEHDSDYEQPNPLSPIVQQYLMMLARLRQQQMHQQQLQQLIVPSSQKVQNPTLGMTTSFNLQNVSNEMFAVRHNADSNLSLPPSSTSFNKSLIAPSALAWFNPETVSFVEKGYLHKLRIDENQYLNLRNSSIAQYQKKSETFMPLSGPVEISEFKIYHLVDYLGLINFAADPKTFPAKAKRNLDWSFLPVSSSPASNSSSPNHCISCGKTPVNYITRPRSGVTPQGCCSQCFSAGAYPENLTDESFEKVKSTSMPQILSEQQQTSLIEAISNSLANQATSGSSAIDWKEISASTSISVEQCILAFASLPINEAFTKSLKKTEQASAGVETIIDLFSDLDNPVMTLLSLISSCVSPVISSTGAQKLFTAIAKNEVSYDNVEKSAEIIQAGIIEKTEDLIEMEIEKIEKMVPEVIHDLMKKVETKLLRLGKLNTNIGVPIQAPLPPGLLRYNP